MFGAGVAGLCAVSETFASGFDRRVWRPVRNYHTAMLENGTFHMPEDFTFMLTEVKDGLKQIGKPDVD